MNANPLNVNRRQAIAAAITASGAMVSGGFGSDAAAAPTTVGNAEHVISIWLGGGMGQMDTFDPKRLGDPKSRKPGSYYSPIETAVPGVQICEHLPRLANLMEVVTAVRSIHHEVIDEHAAATNRMHTGRDISGTVTYPSIGSIVANQLGATGDGVPPYILIGYPNVTRGPGFLGAANSYLYLTETGRGPAGLSRPDAITADRQTRRETFLRMLHRNGKPSADARMFDYDAAIEQSLRLSGSTFSNVFDLSNESDSLRNRYGGELGQRCLLARRLCQRGVRFVEVSHNLNFLNGAGWDVHNAGILDQHKLIAELDQAMSMLIIDLRRTGMLEKTLITVTTEFGRPPEFDSGGGRGHQGKAFTCVLAGGGLNHCGAYGVTDELSKNVVRDSVSVPDFFATVFATVGIDHAKNLYDGDRPVPITDNGRPITQLFG